DHGAGVAAARPHPHDVCARVEAQLEQRLAGDGVGAVADRDHADPTPPQVLEPLDLGHDHQAVGAAGAGGDHGDDVRVLSLDAQHGVAGGDGELRLAGDEGSHRGGRAGDEGEIDVEAVTLPE